mgnify:CR=1 FL=1
MTVNLMLNQPPLHEPDHRALSPEIAELLELLQGAMNYQFRRQGQLQSLKQEVVRLRLARNGRSAGASQSW